jgi:hypothetical protein
MPAPTHAFQRRWIVWLLIGLAVLALAWIAVEIGFAINHSA